MQREVGIVAALGQVELHLRRDDRLPASVGVKLQDLFKQVAWRQLDRIALLVVGVVDHLGSRFDGPGHEEYGVLVRTADHVDVGRIEQFVINVVLDIVAGDGLQQHTLGKAHALLVEELVGR
ncbi:hypothetical protein D9M68_841560 [compost metagenome]